MPTLKDSAASKSCGNLTFSAEFRRLFARQASFAQPKDEKVAGHGDGGYLVTCDINAGGGPQNPAGFASFQYASDTKAGCDRDGLKNDPADPNGGYSKDSADWHYTLCTKLGFVSILYHQGTEGRPTDLATLSRLGHEIADSSWELDALFAH